MDVFTREADMLDPIVGERRKFTSQRTPWEYFFEVQTPQGVVDIIFAVIHSSRLEVREKWAVQPVQDKPAVDALVALSAKSRQRFDEHPTPIMSTSDISEKILVSRSHLRQKVLPQLVDLGWIERLGRGEWVCRHAYKNPVTSIYAIEVKRSDWQRALMQAAPHRKFANKTYLAMDAGRLPRSTESLEGALRFANVGMISVSASQGNESLAVVIDPRRRAPASNDRALVSERLLAIRSSGGNAGELNHVFGQWVTTSTGPDPRRSML